MTFVLEGVQTFNNIRRYYFDAIGEDRSRQHVTVSADLDLIRRYGIPLQELPLLCRRLLEGRTKIETTTFTEMDMAQCASERAAAENALMEKRQSRRPPAPSRDGQAWRGFTVGSGER